MSPVASPLADTTRPADISIRTPQSVIDRYFENTDEEAYEDQTAAITTVSNKYQRIPVPSEAILSRIDLEINYTLTCMIPRSSAGLGWNRDGDRKLISAVNFKGTDNQTRYDQLAGVAFDYVEQATTDDGKDQGYASLYGFSATHEASYFKPPLRLPSGGRYGTPFTVSGRVELHIPFQKGHRDPRGMVRLAGNSQIDRCDFRLMLNCDAAGNLTGDDDWPIGASNGATAKLTGISIVPTFYRRETGNPRDGGGSIQEPDAEFGVVQYIQHNTKSLKTNQFNWWEFDTDWAITQIIQWITQAGVQMPISYDLAAGTTSPIKTVHNNYGSRVSPKNISYAKFVSDLHRETGRYFNFTAWDYRDETLETDRIPMPRFGYDCDSTLDASTTDNSLLHTVARQWRRVLPAG